jgi:hypothetical protein
LEPPVRFDTIWHYLAPFTETLSTRFNAAIYGPKHCKTAGILHARGVSDLLADRSFLFLDFRSVRGTSFFPSFFDLSAGPSGGQIVFVPRFFRSVRGTLWRTDRFFLRLSFLFPDFRSVRGTLWRTDRFFLRFSICPRDLLADRSFLFLDFHSHIQPYTTIYSHIQPYTAVCNHIQPYTAIYSHMQQYAAIYSRMQPCAAICSHMPYATIFS